MVHGVVHKETVRKEIWVVIERTLTNGVRAMKVQKLGEIAFTFLIDISFSKKLFYNMPISSFDENTETGRL